ERLGEVGLLRRSVSPHDPDLREVGPASLGRGPGLAMVGDGHPDVARLDLRRLLAIRTPLISEGARHLRDRGECLVVRVAGKAQLRCEIGPLEMLRQYTREHPQEETEQREYHRAQADP